MKKLTIDPKYTKTYKTVANLEKALENLNLPSGLRYLECYADNGRVTAVFVNASTVEGGMYLSAVAHAGFKVVS